MVFSPTVGQLSSYHPMRRSLFVSIITSVTLAPAIALAAFTLPSQVLMSVQFDGKPMDIAFEAHGHMEDMDVSAWISGQSQNHKDIKSAKAALKATYYFSEEVTDTVVSTGFAVLRPKLTSPSEYISLITQSSIFTEQVIQNSVGTAYPAITESKLGRVMVPIPQDTEQVNIIEFAQRKFEDIDKALSRVKIEMELLREYRTRLTADVVTGKVDVRQVAKNLPIENDLIVDEINEDDVEVNEKFEESNEL
jgi:2',3'-cyclic-nucleotide 2'-phosphodiesterase (5'-nucleotidase family)